MISIKGIFENGEIKAEVEPGTEIPDNAKILITFLSNDEQEDASPLESVESIEEPVSEIEIEEPKSEDYYKSLREFQRVAATGNITIIDGESHDTYRLFDYSQGGLCFISNRQFGVGTHISAGITDPSMPDMVLMELEMEVRGMFKSDNSFKIGCMFLDKVDEDLWHGLLQYLS